MSGWDILKLLLPGVLVLGLAFSAEFLIPDRAPAPAPETPLPAEETHEQLVSLGYIDGTFDPRDGAGVVQHDRAQVWPGLNFYHSCTRAEAQLIDMEGGIIHRWSHGETAWQHAELLADGSLLVLVKDEGVFKLDRDSNLVWRTDLAAHHDLWVDDDGQIWVLTHHVRQMPEVHPDADVLEDMVTVLGADGTVLAEHSLLQIFVDSPYGFLLPSERPEGAPMDVLHVNHVQVLDGSHEELGAPYRRGNLLIGARAIDAIAIIDPEEQAIAWLWGPSNLHWPHHPVMLEDGHLLVFDNGQERSSVLELEPLTGGTVWTYAPRKGFFSMERGSNQRLPNGNTLITESDTGYAFEVTPEGEQVWRFANPDVSEDGVRRAIWRMSRFAPGELVFTATPP